ncbi:hypothetical protein VTN77DRAFT_7932 [Rasamsonia byssochlamydoides]|uniref:uncharacterized protein n=1 Tax=Rasamsonia byssochlamydoides TaxID=89139 RepID=UPI003741ECFE
MRFFTASVFAALAAAVSAYTQPDYSQPPTGNPIYTPGLNQQVPVGVPFEITWDPTTTGTVSLVLLRGPSTNIKPLYAIAENIPNDGKFSWTPSTSLQNDVTHYGLLLVDDATGQYQYSTQFGISNPASAASSSAAVSSAAATSAAVSSAVAASSAVPTPSETIVPVEETETATPTATPSVTATVAPTPAVTTVPVEETTTICPETETATATPSSSGVYPIATGNVSVPVPLTRTPNVPTTLYSVKPATSATSAVSPLFTGAADRNMVSFGGVAAVAGVAALLAF